MGSDFKKKMRYPLAFYSIPSLLINVQYSTHKALRPRSITNKSNGTQHVYSPMPTASTDSKSGHWYGIVCREFKHCEAGWKVAETALGTSSVKAWRITGPPGASIILKCSQELSKETLGTLKAVIGPMDSWEGPKTDRKIAEWIDEKRAVVEAAEKESGVTHYAGSQSSS